MTAVVKYAASRGMLYGFQVLLCHHSIPGAIIEMQMGIHKLNCTMILQLDGTELQQALALGGLVYRVSDIDAMIR